MSTEYKKIYMHVVSILNTKLPDYLTYHDTHHTLYVLEKTINIATKEKVSKKELILLKIAALYHDIGFIKSHLEHEREGCEIAKKELIQFNISKEDIAVICGMIRATKIPHDPKTKLEMILVDADLEYLGTNNFKPFGDKLFKEFKYFIPELKKKDWNTIQIDFLKTHTYYTSFCKQYKEHRKQKHLQLLLN